jgi:hypothetical protein
MIRSLIASPRKGWLKDSRDSTLEGFSNPLLFIIGFGVYKASPPIPLALGIRSLALILFDGEVKGDDSSHL